MKSTEVLALVSGYVEEEILLRNEYLAAENEILRTKISKLNLNNSERVRLAKIAHNIGRKALKGVSAIVKPETLLRWYRDLVTKKFDGSEQKRALGRPKISPELEGLILHLAEDNPSWGWDRIAGALQNLGYQVSVQSIGKVLKRHGIPPTTTRNSRMQWSKFINAHKDVIASCDFLTVEVMQDAQPVTFYVLLFIHLESRKVHIAGITTNPNEKWMKQIARNLTMEGNEFLKACPYLIHDRDTKFTAGFCRLLSDEGIKTIRLPPHSPNLNAYVERVILSIKSECLNHLILFSVQELYVVLDEYLQHYHEERNHQGKGNQLLSPEENYEDPVGTIQKRSRLGGLPNFYYREAA